MGIQPGHIQSSCQGTNSSQKNELLFRDYGINYAHLPEQYRKGSTIIKLEVRRSSGVALR